MAANENVANFGGKRLPAFAYRDRPFRYPVDVGPGNGRPVAYTQNPSLWGKMIHIISPQRLALAARRAHPLTEDERANDPHLVRDMKWTPAAVLEWYRSLTPYERVVLNRCFPAQGNAPGLFSAQAVANVLVQHSDNQRIFFFAPYSAEFPIRGPLTDFCHMMIQISQLYIEDEMDALAYDQVKRYLEALLTFLVERVEAGIETRIPGSQRTYANLRDREPGVNRAAFLQQSLQAVVYAEDQVTARLEQHAVANAPGQPAMTDGDFNRMLSILQVADQPPANFGEAPPVQLPAAPQPSIPANAVQTAQPQVKARRPLVEYPDSDDDDDIIQIEGDEEDADVTSIQNTIARAREIIRSQAQEAVVLLQPDAVAEQEQEDVQPIRIEHYSDDERANDGFGDGDDSMSVELPGGANIDEHINVVGAFNNDIPTAPSGLPPRYAPSKSIPQPLHTQDTPDGPVLASVDDPVTTKNPGKGPHDGDVPVPGKDHFQQADAGGGVPTVGPTSTPGNASPSIMPPQTGGIPGNKPAAQPKSIPPKSKGKSSKKGDPGTGGPGGAGAPIAVTSVVPGVQQPASVPTSTPAPGIASIAAHPQNSATAPIQPNQNPQPQVAPVAAQNTPSNFIIRPAKAKDPIVPRAPAPPRKAKPQGPLMGNGRPPTANQIAAADAARAADNLRRARDVANFARDARAARRAGLTNTNSTTAVPKGKAAVVTAAPATAAPATVAPATVAPATAAPATAAPATAAPATAATTATVTVQATPKAATPAAATPAAATPAAKPAAATPAAATPAAKPAAATPAAATPTTATPAAATPAAAAPATATPAAATPAAATPATATPAKATPPKATPAAVTAATPAAATPAAAPATATPTAATPVVNPPATAFDGWIRDDGFGNEVEDVRIDAKDFKRKLNQYGNPTAADVISDLTRTRRQIKDLEEQLRANPDSQKIRRKLANARLAEATGARGIGAEAVDILRRNDLETDIRALDHRDIALQKGTGDELREAERLLAVTKDQLKGIPKAVVGLERVHLELYRNQLAGLIQAYARAAADPYIPRARQLPQAVQAVPAPTANARTLLSTVRDWISGARFRGVRRRTPSPQPGPVDIDNIDPATYVPTPPGTPAPAATQPVGNVDPRLDPRLVPVPLPRQPGAGRQPDATVTLVNGTVTTVTHIDAPPNLPPPGGVLFPRPGDGALQPQQRYPNNQGAPIAPPRRTTPYYKERELDGFFGDENAKKVALNGRYVAEIEAVEGEIKRLQASGQSTAQMVDHREKLIHDRLFYTGRLHEPGLPANPLPHQIPPPAQPPAGLPLVPYPWQIAPPAQPPPGVLPLVPHPSQIHPPPAQPPAGLPLAPHPSQIHPPPVQPPVAQGTDKPKYPVRELENFVGDEKARKAAINAYFEPALKWEEDTIANDIAAGHSPRVEHRDALLHDRDFYMRQGGVTNPPGAPVPRQVQNPTTQQPDVTKTPDPTAGGSGAPTKFIPPAHRVLDSDDSAEESDDDRPPPDGSRLRALQAAQGEQEPTEEDLRALDDEFEALNTEEAKDLRTRNNERLLAPFGHRFPGITADEVRQHGPRLADLRLAQIGEGAKRRLTRIDRELFNIDYVIDGLYEVMEDGNTNQDARSHAAQRVEGYKASRVQVLERRRQLIEEAVREWRVIEDGAGKGLKGGDEQAPAPVAGSLSGNFIRALDANQRKRGFLPLDDDLIQRAVEVADPGSAARRRAPSAARDIGNAEEILVINKQDIEKAVNAARNAERFQQDAVERDLKTSRQLEELREFAARNEARSASDARVTSDIIRLEVAQREAANDITRYKQIVDKQQVTIAELQRERETVERTRSRVLQEEEDHINKETQRFEQRIQRLQLEQAERDREKSLTIDKNHQEMDRLRQELHDRTGQYESKLQEMGKALASAQSSADVNRDERVREIEALYKRLQASYETANEASLKALRRKEEELDKLKELSRQQALAAQTDISHAAMAHQSIYKKIFAEMHSDRSRGIASLLTNLASSLPEVSRVSATLPEDPQVLDTQRAAAYIGQLHREMGDLEGRAASATELHEANRRLQATVERMGSHDDSQLLPAIIHIQKRIEALEGTLSAQAAATQSAGVAYAPETHRKAMITHLNLVDQSTQLGADEFDQQRDKREQLRADQADLIGTLSQSASILEKYAPVFAEELRTAIEAGDVPKALKVFTESLPTITSGNNDLQDSLRRHGNLLREREKEKTILETRLQAARTDTKNAIDLQRKASEKYSRAISDLETAKEEQRRAVEEHQKYVASIEEQRARDRQEHEDQLRLLEEQHHRVHLEGLTLLDDAVAENHRRSQVATREAHRKDLEEKLSAQAAAASRDYEAKLQAAQNRLLGEKEALEEANLKKALEAEATHQRLLTASTELNERLRNDVARLTETVRRADQELEVTGGYHQQLVKLQESTAESVREREEAISRLANSEHEGKLKQANLDRLHLELQRLTTENDGNVGRIAQINAELDHLRRNFEADVSSQASERMSRAQAIVDAHQLRVHELELAKVNLTAGLAYRERAIQHILEDQDKILSAVGSAAAPVRQSRRVWEDLSEHMRLREVNAIDETEAELQSRLKQEREKAHAKATNIKKTLDVRFADTRTDREEKERTILNLQRDHAKFVRDKNEELARQAQNIEETEKRVVEGRSTIAAYTEEIAALKAAIAKRPGPDELQQLQQQMRQLDDESATLRERVKGHELQLENAQTTIRSQNEHLLRREVVHNDTVRKLEDELHITRENATADRIKAQNIRQELENKIAAGEFSTNTNNRLVNELNEGHNEAIRKVRQQHATELQDLLEQLRQAENARIAAERSNDDDAAAIATAQEDKIQDQIASVTEDASEEQSIMLTNRSIEEEALRKRTDATHEVYSLQRKNPELFPLGRSRDNIASVKASTSDVAAAAKTAQQAFVNVLNTPSSNAVASSHANSAKSGPNFSVFGNPEDDEDDLEAPELPDNTPAPAKAVKGLADISTDGASTPAFHTVKATAYTPPIAIVSRPADISQASLLQSPNTPQKLGGDETVVRGLVNRYPQKPTTKKVTSTVLKAPPPPIRPSGYVISDLQSFKDEQRALRLEQINSELQYQHSLPAVDEDRVKELQKDEANIDAFVESITARHVIQSGRRYLGGKAVDEYPTASELLEFGSGDQHHYVKALMAKERFELRKSGLNLSNVAHDAAALLVGGHNTGLRRGQAVRDGSLKAAQAKVARFDAIASTKDERTLEQYQTATKRITNRLSFLTGESKHEALRGSGEAENVFVTQLVMEQIANDISLANSHEVVVSHRTAARSRLLQYAKILGVKTTTQAPTLAPFLVIDTRRGVATKFREVARKILDLNGVDASEVSKEEHKEQVQSVEKKLASRHSNIAARGVIALDADDDGTPDADFVRKRRPAYVVDTIAEAALHPEISIGLQRSKAQYTERRRELERRLISSEGLPGSAALAAQYSEALRKEEQGEEKRKIVRTPEEEEVRQRQALAAERRAVYTDQIRPVDAQLPGFSQRAQKPQARRIKYTTDRGTSGFPPRVDFAPEVDSTGNLIPWSELPLAAGKSHPTQQDIADARAQSVQGTWKQLGEIYGKPYEEEYLRYLKFDHDSLFYKFG